MAFRENYQQITMASVSYYRIVSYACCVVRRVDAAISDPEDTLTGRRRDIVGFVISCCVSEPFLRRAERASNTCMYAHPH